MSYDNLIQNHNELNSLNLITTKFLITTEFAFRLLQKKGNIYQTLFLTF